MLSRLRSVRRAAAALSVAALCGCSTLSLHNDPMAPSSAGDDSRAVPIQLFDVEWWKPLVAAQMWDYAPRELATPAVDPDTGRIVVGTRDFYIRSFDPEGNLEWSVKTYGSFSAGGMIKDGVLYMPGGDGTLYALDARTGEERWKYASGEELATIPVLADGKVLVASQNDTLYAVDAKTGKWVWQYKRDPPPGFTIRGMSTPTVANGKVYLGFSDGVLAALELKDGVAKWERSLSGGVGAFLDVDTQPLVDDAGRLFVASYKDGVFALNAESGDVVWQSAIAGITSLLAKGDVVFATGDARVSALLAESGRSIWSLELKGRAGRIPTLVNGLLLVPADGSLVFVDPATGHSKLAWDPGQGISAAPRFANSRLYVISNNGSLFSMRLSGRGG